MKVMFLQALNHRDLEVQIDKLGTGWRLVTVYQYRDQVVAWLQEV